MAEIPQSIYDGQSFAQVMARIRQHPSLAGLRTDPDSNVYRLITPTVVEITSLYIECQRVLELTSVLGEPGHRAYGSWLDQYVVQMSSISRVQATQAEVPVRFSGTPGTVVPVDYAVIAPGLVPQRYTLMAEVTIGQSGVGDGTVRAVNSGSQGNVAAGAISQLTTAITGLSGVTNLVEPSRMGLDTETDQSLINRFLTFMRDQPNGSNPAQYETWAREVPGIGNAVVLRPGEENGPIGSRLYLFLVDSNMQPASQQLCDDVLEYISPARTYLTEAELMNVFNATGVTVDLAQVDDSGSSQLMQYAMGGQGELRQSISSGLVQGGLWTARPRMKVNNNTGTADLVTIEVYDVTTAQMAQTRDTGGVPSTVTLQANDLELAFTQPVVEFYWNRTDTMEIRIRRLASDTTTQLWVDYAWMQSMFSSYDDRGLANATAEVHVFPALAQNMTVAVQVKLVDNAVEADVISAIQTAITDYYKEIALRPDDVGGNDVIYGEVGSRIQDVPGVAFYEPATFRVNGATANVIIDKRTVAIPDPINPYTITIEP